MYRNTKLSQAITKLFSPSLAIILYCGVLNAPANAIQPQGYTLAWRDEFHNGIGAKPNPAVWSYEIGGGGWGNEELQTYVDSAANCHIVRDAAATDGQALMIQATKDGNGDYTSARIITNHKHSTKFGYIEARMRVPVGRGVCPAFWMMGNNFETAHWPNCGEIDIMHHVGSEPSINHGSVYGPGAGGGSGSVAAIYRLPGGRQFQDAYHLYAVKWSPDALTFFVDGKSYLTASASKTNGAGWPFRQPFFFILNLAVGGRASGDPGPTTSFPQSFLIDYIRVYQRGHQTHDRTQ